MRRGIEVRLRWITRTLLLLGARLKITDQIKRSIFSFSTLKIAEIAEVSLFRFFQSHPTFFASFVFSLRF
jgi:hypothetical protein